MKLHPAKEFYRKYKIPLAAIISLGAWIILAFYFERPGGLSPSICVLMAMLLSNTYEPRQTIGLALLVGYPASLIWGINIIVTNIQGANFLEISAIFLGTFFFILTNIIFYVLSGLIYGNIATLIRRKAIF